MRFFGYLCCFVEIPVEICGVLWALRGFVDFFIFLLPIGHCRVREEEVDGGHASAGRLSSSAQDGGECPCQLQDSPQELRARGQSNAENCFGLRLKKKEREREIFVCFLSV